MLRLTRRRFVQLTTATALTTPVLGRHAPRLGANEEIRAAVIGVRSRGRAHIDALQRLDGVRVVALCDVDRKILAERRKSFTEKWNKDVDGHVDVREVLDRNDIDVVAIATPNHWHALMTVWACEAGKDVYVEKPVSHNVWEGRQMVRAARRFDRIVQTGTQSRSSRAIAEAIAWMHEGHLGPIRIARGFCYKPRKSIGHVTHDQPIPAHIDYDLWTGPAPRQPLRRKNLHYDWHWVFATGNGDLGNQGVHQMDICRWALGVDTLPAAVGSIGGRYGYVDNGNTPNTQLAWFDYRPAPILFEVRGLPRDTAAQSGDWGMDRYNGVSIGVIIECANGYLRVPNYSKASAHGPDGEEIKSWKGASDHFANFIDAVRDRAPSTLNADIEKGHVSSALCHLANTSYKLATPVTPTGMHQAIDEVPGLQPRAAAHDTVQRCVDHLGANGVDLDQTPLMAGRWLGVDPVTERFVDDDEANALLTRQYRAPFVVPEVQA